MTKELAITLPLDVVELLLEAVTTLEIPAEHAAAIDLVEAEIEAVKAAASR